jgi:hypothetical protein
MTYKKMLKLFSYGKVWKGAVGDKSDISATFYPIHTSDKQQIFFRFFCFPKNGFLLAQTCLFFKEKKIASRSFLAACAVFKMCNLLKKKPT